MIRAVIVDDEKHSVVLTEELLKKVSEKVVVIKTFTNAEKALSFLNKNKFDLLFLDIEMPIMSGFDLLEKTTNQEFDVIFITAFNEYAIKAFSVGAISYLLKPIDTEDLEHELTKWKAKKEKNRNEEQLELARSYMKTQEIEKIVLPTSNGFKFVKMTDIIRCESFKNYTEVHIIDEKSVIVSRTLKDFERLLADHQYVRIHNSHLINLRHIKQFIKSDGGQILMDDESLVPVSRKNKENLMEWINQFMRL